MKYRKIYKYKFVKEEDYEYLNELETVVSESKFLPKYHIYPKSGLMNDPNGLSYFNGEYHVFYQWFPFEPTHGMKHWGHVVSKDLIHWKDKGLALIPNKEYEKNGCYSGGAIEKDGLLYLFYTANYKTDNGKIPKQAVAVMDRDGNINKYEKNPIIDGAPLGFSGELRDPFVFKRNGLYYMLLGGSSSTKPILNSFGDKGELLIYKSENLLEWSYLGTIGLPIDTGYMLECPSLVEIDGKDVLFLSPMGYKPKEENYNNRFASIYLIGKLDIENLSFHMDTMDELDGGFDYYAPQAFYGKDNRVLTFAWFGCGEPMYESDKDMWKHGLTTPQALTIKNQQLYRYPIYELQQMFHMSLLNEKVIKTKSNNYHLRTEVINDNENYEISFGTERDIWKININSLKGKVTVDRSDLKNVIDLEYGLTRSTTVSNNREKIVLDIFVDNSFVEVYVNEGEKVLSFRVFNLSNQHEIRLPDNILAKLGYLK